MCRAQLSLEDAFSSEMRFSHIQGKNGKAQVDEAETNAQQLFSRLLHYITCTHMRVYTHAHTQSAALLLKRLLPSITPTNSRASSPPPLPAQNLDPEARITGDSDQDQGSLSFLPSHIISCFELSSIVIQPGRPEQGKNFSCQKS